jgi:hypothetical protein
MNPKKYNYNFKGIIKLLNDTDFVSKDQYNRFWFWNDFAKLAYLDNKRNMVFTTLGNQNYYYSKYTLKKARSVILKFIPKTIIK